MIANVAHGIEQRTTAPLQPDRTQLACCEKHIPHSYNASDSHTQSRGYSCSPKPPSHEYYHKPVEEDIGYCRHYVAPHGEARTAVKTNDKQQQCRPHAEHLARHESQQVLTHQWQQGLGRTKHPRYCRGEQHHGDCHRQDYHCGEYPCLGDIDAGSLELVLRHMDGCHNRASGSHHQPQSRHHHQYRHTYIYGCYSVGTNGMPYEYSVYGCHCRYAEHTQQGRKKIAPEKARNTQRTEVDGVFCKFF